MKKIPGDIIILHKCTKNYDHMLYCSWDMVHDRWGLFFFSFWVFFFPFTLTARRYHLSPGDIITLHTCSKNYDQLIYSSWYIVHNGWTYGQTDRRKKWHIEVGVPPKKFISTNAYSILLKKSFQSSCILMRFPKNSF